MNLWFENEMEDNIYWMKSSGNRKGIVTEQTNELANIQFSCLEKDFQSWYEIITTKVFILLTN